MSQDGSAEFYQRTEPIPVELTLSCTPECTEGLKWFVAVMAEGLAFDAQTVASLQDAVGEVCESIAGSAYLGDRSCCYHVMITQNDGQLVVQTADYGETLETTAEGPDGRTSRFPTAERVMDEFEIHPHPNGGNILRMSKTAPAA